MSHKRMFSMSIVDTDAFLEMPATAQLLYFHLSMRADDEGFVGNPKKIMRMCGFGEDDLKVLVAKRFLLTFESGVVVIKHWLIHNTIRKDRFVPTTYSKEKQTLQIKENKSYTDHWHPNGNQLATQYSIEENRIDIEEKRQLSDDSLSYGDKYKADHNPPKRKKRILSDKQKAVLKRMKCLDYFHEQGVKLGYEYLLEEDDQANRKFLGLAQAFEKRYKENWKEVVDWWFESDNAWCDYHPSNFFSIGTYLKFDNKHSNKPKLIKL